MERGKSGFNTENITVGMLSENTFANTNGFTVLHFPQSVRLLPMSWSGSKINRHAEKIVSNLLFIV